MTKALFNCEEHKIKKIPKESTNCLKLRVFRMKFTSPHPANMQILYWKIETSKESVSTATKRQQAKQLKI
jgi:hypothetical protein